MVSILEQINLAYLDPSSEEAQTFNIIIDTLRNIDDMSGSTNQEILGIIISTLLQEEEEEEEEQQKGPRLPFVKVKSPRAPAAYNIFMRDEIRRLSDICPDSLHEDIVKLAASNWNFYKSKPKDEKENEPKRTFVKVNETPRSPSAYEFFMKDEVKRLKDECPSLPHKTAFKIASSNWKFYKSKPKDENEPKRTFVKVNETPRASAAYNIFMRDEIKRLSDIFPYSLNEDIVKLADSNFYKSKTKDDKENEPKRTFVKVNETPRSPSAYQFFMKDEVNRLKDECPLLSRREAFQLAASNWKFYKSNSKYEEENIHS